MVAKAPTAAKAAPHRHGDRLCWNVNQYCDRVSRSDKFALRCLDGSLRNSHHPTESGFARSTSQAPPRNTPALVVLERAPTERISTNSCLPLSPPPSFGDPCRPPLSSLACYGRLRRQPSASTSEYLIQPPPGCPLPRCQSERRKFQRMTPASPRCATWVPDRTLSL